MKELNGKVSRYGSCFTGFWVSMSGAVMLIFNSDLDNTLIYSYKHDIGENKGCVEIYQGREISFMTERSLKLLKTVNDKVLLVPTTTRTEEQYGRINLGIGVHKYALACNGGVLLVNGQSDEEWYKESLEMITESRTELIRAEKYLKEDEYRSFELRNIRDLFLFTKSSEPEISAQRLREKLDMSVIDIFTNGVKVYAVPKKLSKGNAVKRLKKRLGAEKIVAAGDSEFDISMLNAADYAIAPEALVKTGEINNSVVYVKEGSIFSEKVLEYVLELAEGYTKG